MSTLRELVEQATPPGRITDDETEAAVERAAALLYPLAPELARLASDMADALDLMLGMLRFPEDQQAGDAMAGPLLARFAELEGRAGNEQ